MKSPTRYQLLGGPCDGDSPPWADGRPEVLVPLLPDWVPLITDAPGSGWEHIGAGRYRLTRFEDGRIAYVWEGMRTRPGPTQPA